MSGNEDRAGELNRGLAFEYVSGTLPVDERAAFAARMREDPWLQREVRFWEEQLMAIQDDNQVRAPKSSTWTRIQARINRANDPGRQSVRTWQWPWKYVALTLSFVWIFSVAFWAVDREQVPALPNADYVAVLLADDGEPLLTALTSSDGRQLWLKWEQTFDFQDHSVQLWAASRRDGQVRPLLVFDKQQSVLSLDEAGYRLIRDSAFLMLTREEYGGSAIDEPSDELLAKGVCVRLNERA
ncbi:MULTISPECIES: anti-sigma factor domain-containing protein [unclassified Microbulbifer]|uniref:anti-sigma factor n=1 Tax=unclassified Microbulbifer TaxID=2619833 RepID=UPI0027E41670|nr:MULTISPECIES: anti-sigma factor [unclassified Microbulbifer]